MIVWKQTHRIISAGETLIRKDSRMSLIKGPKGINLQIENVTPDDRGNTFVGFFSKKIGANCLLVIFIYIITVLHEIKGMFEKCLHSE